MTFQTSFLQHFWEFSTQGPPSMVMGPWHGLVKARQVAQPAQVAESTGSEVETN